MKDSMGNIYATRGVSDNYPLLNAHMDIVYLRDRFGSFFKNSKSSTKSNNSKKGPTKTINPLMVGYNDYEAYLSKEIEDIISKKASNLSKKFIEVSNDEAIKIWDEDKETLKQLFGEEYREMGFKCAHCVNSCKAYKLCYFFKPNNNLETKIQYAKYRKKIELNNISSESFVQESFDLSNNIKSLNSIEPEQFEVEDNKEKYIIKVDLIDDKISGSGKNRVLGGDDKCGIFIALKVAEILKDIPMKILFTVEEETGCNGAKHFVKTNSRWLDDVKYSLTIDRRDYRHLLWSQRGVRSCSDDFAAELMYHGIRVGIPVQLEDGGSADVVVLRDYVPNAVNISAGYYKAHSSSEYIVPSEVDKIVGWVKNIVNYV